MVAIGSWPFLRSHSIRTVYPSQHKVMVLSLEVHRDSTSVLFFTYDKVIATTLQLSETQYSRNKNNGMKTNILLDD